jgi:hypothetical protein
MNNNFDQTDVVFKPWLNGTENTAGTRQRMRGININLTGSSTRITAEQHIARYNDAEAYQVPLKLTTYFAALHFNRSAKILTWLHSCTAQQCGKQRRDAVAPATKVVLFGLDGVKRSLAAVLGTRPTELLADQRQHAAQSLSVGKHRCPWYNLKNGVKWQWQSQYIGPFQACP